MQVRTEDVERFLDGHRFAVVGASDDEKNFGGTIYRELKAHGYEPVAVNRSATSVDGDTCFPALEAVPGALDGVIVMVSADAAVDVVRECAKLSIDRVWLFKGVGTGAVSEEALRACAENGIDVIPGACPLMFLEPVAWFHRAHRGMRHLTGSLSRAS